MPSRSLASAAGLRDFPFVKAKQIRVDPQPEQFAFDVPAKLVRAGQKPRHAGVSRQTGKPLRQYQRKFVDFIRLCQESKANGVLNIVVGFPRT